MSGEIFPPITMFRCICFSSLLVYVGAHYLIVGHCFLCVFCCGCPIYLGMPLLLLLCSSYFSDTECPICVSPHLIVLILGLCFLSFSLFLSPSSHINIVCILEISGESLSCYTLFIPFWNGGPYVLDSIFISSLPPTSGDSRFSSSSYHISFPLANTYIW